MFQTSFVFSSSIGFIAQRGHAKTTLYFRCDKLLRSCRHSRSVVSYENFSLSLLIYQTTVTGHYKKVCVPKDYYADGRSQLAPSQCSL